MAWRVEHMDGLNDLALRVDHQQPPLTGCSDHRVTIQEPLTGPNLPSGRKGKHHLLVGGHLHHAARVVVLRAIVIPIEAEQDVLIRQGPYIAGHFGWIFPSHSPVGAVPDDLLRPYCTLAT